MSQNDNKENSKNNVILMPLRRMTKERIQSRLRFDLEQRKMAVAASLVSILLLVALANNSIWKESDIVASNTGSEMGSRDLASVGNATDTVDRDVKWERAMAEQLAMPRKERTQNLANAERPTLQDHFLFSKLRGLYQARYEDGKIVGLVFQRSGDVLDVPVYVGNDEIFDRYKSLLSVNFSSAHMEKQTQDHETKVQVFKLLSKDRSTVAELELRRDAFDRLLSLTVVR